MKSKKKSKETLDFSKDATILTLADTTTRKVTPDNPLIISQVNPTYDNVEIVGGQIFTQVKTSVTFKNLSKTS